MSERFGNLARGFIIRCFGFASHLLRHRPHLAGGEFLKTLPTPVIFSLTHDSYFEVPSLSRIYYSLKPKPDLLVLVKDDFLSGNYLVSNFGQKSKALRAVLHVIDKSFVTGFVIRSLKLTSIHRPFIETYQTKKDVIKAEIGRQINRVRDNISRGISTVAFPEGTTAGFGGLKRIRSAIYQIVENTLKSADKKVYILPINVKVDTLVKGKKDVFINIGRPYFFHSTQEEFNSRLFHALQQLHTITFSQVAACYLKRIAEMQKDAGAKIDLARDRFAAGMERIIAEMTKLVDREALPSIDRKLLDQRYLSMKIDRFVRYCRTKKILLESHIAGEAESFRLNVESILSDYPAKVYRKLNPVGFHANQLLSLGEERIRSIFDAHLGAWQGAAS